ncbi:anoctamin At1g73020 [Olea europaea subsp. europaea]|uniref:Anoctamin At1g73020 n=1 Tax=Olea europaea subsp. europaea TaxID=158383 RepID=A0A8S0PRU6_OLEEU|nr:anoctamin At1g73020 [Olea europaea subsp. europaea]
MIIERSTGCRGNLYFRNWNQRIPFELAYAHLYEVIGSDFLKFRLTAVYLLAIQYFTRMGEKISVKLVKCENNENVEYRARNLVYKMFGLYFIQRYIGIFYHALLHRNLMTLRQVLIQRLIIYEVLENLMENSVPYLTYSFKKFRAIRNKQKRERGSSAGKAWCFPRVEKEYLKPAYAASIGHELEDGLFDGFLELVLQFGMIMMFACAFPLAFTFATLLQWNFSFFSKNKVEDGRSFSLCQTIIMAYIACLTRAE